MKLRVGISTIPGREAGLARIRAALKRDPIIARDDELSGTSCKCYRELMGSAEAAASDWFIMLDDDALLCDNFEAEAERVLSKCPADVCSLFSRQAKLTDEAKRNLSSFILTPHVVYGVAMAIRGPLCAQIVEWGQSHVRPSYRSGDTRVAVWAATMGYTCVASVPSIVEHDPDGISVIEGREGMANKGRQATWFCSKPASVKWNNCIYDGGVPRNKLVTSLCAQGEAWVEQAQLPGFFKALNFHFMAEPGKSDPERFRLAAKVFPLVSDKVKREVWNLLGRRSDGKSLRDVIPMPDEWRTIPLPD